LNCDFKRIKGVSKEKIKQLRFKTRILLKS
jgi:hypothetical protein